MSLDGRKEAIMRMIAGAIQSGDALTADEMVATLKDQAPANQGGPSEMLPIIDLRRQS